MSATQQRENRIFCILIYNPPSEALEMIEEGGNEENAGL
jgi:hypothetical protein